MEWLDRLVSVMDIISEKAREGLGVTDIANESNISKGTLHRMLQDMVNVGLLVQDSKSKKYRLGSKSMVWGSKFLLGQDPSGLLSDYCDLLAEHTGLYTFISRFESGEVYCICTRQPSEKGNRYFVHVGQRMPLSSSAGAKAILAFQPTSVVNSLLMHEDVYKYTEKTKIDLTERLAELNQVVQTRLAFCDQELEPGVSAMSTPIFHAKGEAYLSLSLVGDSAYIDAHRELLARELIQIGEKASQQISAARLLTSLKGV